MSTMLSNTAPVISSGETGVSGVSVDTDHAVESWSSASLGGVISYTAGRSTHHTRSNIIFQKIFSRQMFVRALKANARYNLPLPF